MNPERPPQSASLIIHGRNTVRRRHPQGKRSPSATSFLVGGLALLIGSGVTTHAAEVKARALCFLGPYPGYTTAASGDVTSNYTRSEYKWTWNHSAYASFGLLRLSLNETTNSNNSGGSEGQVSSDAKFTDRITIDAPGRTGTAGVVTLTWRVDGSWKLAHPANEFPYGIAYSADVWLGGANDAPNFSHGLQTFGSDFRNGNRTLTTGFTFGTPIDVSFMIKASTKLTSLNCMAKVNVAGIWGGLKVTANGAPVTDFTVVSDTLTDYRAVDDDGDRMPDGWEVVNGFNPLIPDDAGEDTDGDGQNNDAEYFAGTDPRDPSSVLRASLAQLPTPGERSISFPCVAGHSYTVRYKEDLSPTTPWAVLQHFPSQSGPGVLSATDTSGGSATRRFYQVVTPQQP